MSIKLVKNNPHALLLLVLFFGLVTFFAPYNARAATISRPPSNLGLVGYWAMDEGSGSVANDLSGNGDFGSVSGALWTTGKRGKSLNFDGTDDYLDLSNKGLGDPDLFGGTNGKVSVSLWLKPTRSSGVLYDTILRRIGGMHYMAIVGDGSNRFLRLMVYNQNTAANYWPDSVSTIPVDQWTHIVFILESGVGYKFYINGVLDRSVSETGLVIGNYGSSDSALGGELDGTANYLQGQIDDVRLYNRALSASEILAMYKSGQVTRKTVSNSGLVGYWPLNEGVGTVAGDSSGGGYTGTITAATWANGKRGKALSFDGSGDFVSAPVTASSILNISGNTITQSAWVYPTANVTNGTIATRNAGYYFQRHSDGTLAMYLYGTNSPGYHYSTGTVPLNQWSHVAYTYNGSVITFYINGVAAGTANNTGNITQLTGYENEPFRIGWDSSTDIRYWSGLIDDVRVYNRALSATEILNLYKQNETKINSSQNSRLTNGLVGMWSFNGADISGTTAYDRSGQGNNGTISGATTAVGKVGQGLYFDGGDYIEAAHTASMDVTALTIAMWIKTPTSLCGGVACFRALLSKQGADRDYNFYTYSSDITQITHMHFSSARFGVTMPALTTPYKPGEWHHVAFTVDSSGNYVHYSDGVSFASGTITAGANANSNYPIWIGRADNYYNDIIDEARVYNRALSADEVKQLYNMGK